MEDAELRAVEEVRALAHVEPQRAVALLGAAARADARGAVAEPRHEAAEAAAAARALDAVAAVYEQPEAAEDEAARCLRDERAHEGLRGAVEWLGEVGHLRR